MPIHVGRSEGGARSQDVHPAHRAGAPEEDQAVGRLRQGGRAAARRHRAADQIQIVRSPSWPVARHPRKKASQHRAMRPTWEGHLRLSLVTCPVALYTRHRARRRRALPPDQSRHQQPHPHADRRCRHRRAGRALGPGEGLRGLQEQVRAVRPGRARRGEARTRRAPSTSRSSSMPPASTASTGTSPTISRPPARPASRPSR